MISRCYILCCLLCLYISLCSAFSLLRSLVYEDSLSEEFPESFRLAVCISGQLSRWQPEHLLNGLLAANPGFRFYLFYNLQEMKIPSNDGNGSVFSTDPELNFDVSPMAALFLPDAAAHIRRLLQPFRSYAQLASMAYWPWKSEKEWLDFFQQPSLDRIRDHRGKVQLSILNMYVHHPRCAEQIKEYELRSGWQVDYIINTREDVYFFRPMSLQTIINRLSPTHVSGQPRCDLPYKQCLSFWGFNMRFYLMHRVVGLNFLSKRLQFYGLLFQNNQTVRNPEKFEARQAAWLGYQGCPLSVEVMPVTAARHVRRGFFCFILLEYYQCMPKGMEAWIQQRSCRLVKKRMEVIEAKLREKVAANASTLTSTSKSKRRS